MAMGSAFDSDDVGFDEHCVRALTLADVPEGSSYTGVFEGKYNFPDAKPVPSRYWHPCVIRNGELVETHTPGFWDQISTLIFLVRFMMQHAEQPFLA
jgi:hypothetical protein